MPNSVSIIQATPDDVERIAPLFDLYRQFYDRTSDPDGAEAYIRERLEHEESVIFLALRREHGEDDAAGFTQLYPIFSSVRMIRVWLLNDLFVHPGHRKLGIGRRLMLRAIDHARETGYRGVELATAIDNEPAQALYEDLGFEIEEGFYHYSLRV